MVTMTSRIPALSPHFDEDILSLQTRVAEQDILPYFQNLRELDIETKSSATDFVTIADKQAERPKDEDILLNAGVTTVSLSVANTGDRPIQVGSHYHFYETTLV